MELSIDPHVDAHGASLLDIAGTCAEREAAQRVGHLLLLVELTGASRDAVVVEASLAGAARRDVDGQRAGSGKSEDDESSTHERRGSVYELVDGAPASPLSHRAQRRTTHLALSLPFRHCARDRCASLVRRARDSNESAASKDTQV